MSTLTSHPRRRFLRGAAVTMAPRRGLAGSALALTACDAAPLGFGGGLRRTASTSTARATARFAGRAPIS